MAAFTFPSFDTIWTKAKALWAAERPDASTAPRSDLWVSSYITSKLWHRLHQTGDNVLRAVFPSTTYGVYLDYWLIMLGAPDGSGGLGRIIARGSTGGATDVTFTGVGTVTLGDQLTDADGLVYEFTATYTSAGAETTAVNVQAVSTGSATNLEAADAPTLTITAPGANVNAATTLSTDLDDGADREEDAAGRARLAELLRRGPSGSWSDWVQVIESASPGNLDAYVWPGRELQPFGWGRTDYCALQRNETGIAKHIGSGDSLYATIAAKVAAELPVLLMRNSRELTIVAQGTAIEGTLTLSSDAPNSSKCDWDAEDIKATVVGSTEGTLEIQASVNVHLHLTDNTQDQTVIIDGETATVDRVGVAGGRADNARFTLTTWPWGVGNNPANTRNIMSGGGLIQDCIDATRTDVFDVQGPAKLYENAPILGWKDTIRAVDVQTVCIDVGEGDIVDADMAIPLSPAYFIANPGDGATANRLTEGEITFWEEK